MTVWIPFLGSCLLAVVAFAIPFVVRWWTRRGRSHLQLKVADLVVETKDVDPPRADEYRYYVRLFAEATGGDVLIKNCSVYLMGIYQWRDDAWRYPPGHDRDTLKLQTLEPGASKHSYVFDLHPGVHRVVEALYFSPTKEEVGTWTPTWRPVHNRLQLEGAFRWRFVVQLVGDDVQKSGQEAWAAFEIRAGGPRSNFWFEPEVRRVTVLTNLGEKIEEAWPFVDEEPLRLVPMEK